jgi:acetoin utilization deacetylase AcuC-like enzyme
MSALTAACASRLLRRAVGLRRPIEHPPRAAAAPTTARAIPSLNPSGGEVPFTTSSSSAHDGTDADKSGACERKRPGDDGLPIVYHPAYSKPVMPDGHRFPMPVFREIYRRLIKDGVAVPGKNLFQPARMPSLEELTAVHDEDYVNKFMMGAMTDEEQRKMGLPWTEELVERTLSEVSGTVLTADLALACGLAVNTAGGTHHAHRSHASGYCIFNDLAITAKRVIARGAVERVLIVDLDVHQGDGTAASTADDANIYTLSVHCEDNFPRTKASSSRDVPLPTGTGDDVYIKTTEAALRESIEECNPQLVLYDAGVDVHAADDLGGFELSDEGLIRREALVIDTCVGRGIPVAAVVGGGYDKDMEALARRHCILHHVAREIFESNKL